MVETSTRSARGSGSIRERAPGVRKIRIVVGFDATRGRSVQRSITLRLRGSGAAAALRPGRRGRYQPAAVRRTSHGADRIERGLSAGVLGSTESSRSRRITLGVTTTELINQHYALWSLQQRPHADWLFAPTPARPTHLTADALSHRFARLGRAATIDNPCLHQPCHATPLDDLDIADNLDQLLNEVG